MPEITKEDIAKIVGEGLGTMEKSIDEKNATLMEDVKAETAKAIDEVRKEVKTPDIHSETDIEVNEPEPSFLTNSGEFYQMVAKAANDPSVKVKLAEALEVHHKAPSGANTLISSEGGFLPTAQIQAEIRQNTYDTGQLLAEADVIPLGGTNDRLVWNEVVEDDRSTEGSFGGMRAYRVNEGVAATISQPEYRERELAVSDMMVRFPATRQLLADSVALAAMVSKNAPKAFNKKIDKEIVRGTGAGQCLGILNAAATISVTKETNQVADTLVKANIEKMYDNLDPSLLSGAAWYINPHARKELRNLTVAVGTGGSAVYLPEGNIAGTPFGTLMGLPVKPTNACSKLGDKGDLILANLDDYLIVEKGGVEGAESMHVLFNTNEMMFRWTWRINGMPKMAAQITPENANTADRLSAYVTLDARA